MSPRGSKESPSPAAVGSQLGSRQMSATDRSDIRGYWRAGIKTSPTCPGLYRCALDLAHRWTSGGTAAAAVSEADQPSIAVLPFNNMSDDPGQEYLSDGITEDIITDLSKVSGLFVVGRNTSFVYKGRSVQLQQVASEMGVKFLLEGSVRKSGERVRVTAQLIDGVAGGHVWADRFDRDLTDIFAIQDEIAKAIVEQLKIRLLPTEKTAIERPPTANVEAYTLYLKGRQFFKNFTKSFVMLARQMFTQAVELDPISPGPMPASPFATPAWWAFSASRCPAEEILSFAAKALTLDPESGRSPCRARRCAGREQSQRRGPDRV